MSEHDPYRNKIVELFELADKVDPDSADGIFLNAVARGITDANLDIHRLDDILDENT